MNAIRYIADHKWPLMYLVGGQAGWFACVLSAAREVSWIGVAVVSVLLILHLLAARWPFREVKLIVAVAVMGAVWESAMVLEGILGYPHGSGSLHRAPVWIVALWALFAAQINVAYQWLKGRLAIAALLGAVAGPLSFRAGAALGAVRIEKGGWTFVVLALGWALLLPVAVTLSRRWNGIADPAASA